MENGGREQDRGSESDEDEDSEQNTSETGRYRDGGGRLLTEHGLVSFQPLLCLSRVLCPSRLQVRAGQQTSGSLEGQRRPRPRQAGTAQQGAGQRHRSRAGPTSLSSSLSPGEIHTHTAQRRFVYWFLYLYINVLQLVHTDPSRPQHRKQPQVQLSCGLGQRGHRQTSQTEP